MKRPRNRQSRPPHENNNASRGNNSNRGGRGGRGVGRQNHAPRPNYHPVPSTRQVVPGATVSIVLKQDQGTGREVQGQVQDLLTRGEHPRGIKVRLVDGRVGRVQSIVDASGGSVTAGTGLVTGMRNSNWVGSGGSSGHRETSIDNDDDAFPPPRSLADFLPRGESDQEPDNTAVGQSEVTFATATARCPICNLFEGDEVAVSHHVETVHLT